jgi:hypothetical protein
MHPARWQCVKSWRGTNPTLAINDGEILVVWIVFFLSFFLLLEEDEEVGAETRKSLNRKLCLSVRVVCRCAAVCAALLTRFLMGFLEYLWYTHTHTGEKDRGIERKEEEEVEEERMTFFCGERGKPLKFLTAAADAAAVVVDSPCAAPRLRWIRSRH